MISITVYVDTFDNKWTDYLKLPTNKIIQLIADKNQT